MADPLLDLALLRRRRVAVAAAMTFLYAAALFAVLLSFLLFFVDRWSLDLVQAGAAVVPMGLVVVLLTTRVGRLADLVGLHPTHRRREPMAVGLVVSAATLSGDHFAVGWLPLAVLIGIGVGLCYPLLAAAAVHGLHSADLAAASALNQSARQLGAALGVATAVGVLVFRRAFPRALPRRLAAGRRLQRRGGPGRPPCSWPVGRPRHRPRSLPHPSPTHHRGVFRMSSPSLIYALTDDEDRAGVRTMSSVTHLRSRSPGAREPLPDGSELTLRPLEPEDGDLLREVFDGMGRAHASDGS